MPKRGKGTLDFRRCKVDRLARVECVACGAQRRQRLAGRFELDQRGEVRPRDVRALAAPSRRGDRFPNARDGSAVADAS